MKWTGREWRTWESIIRAVIEYNPTGKRSLGKSRLRCEDYIMRDVGTVKPRV